MLIALDTKNLTAQQILATKDQLSILVATAKIVLVGTPDDIDNLKEKLTSSDPSNIGYLHLTAPTQDPNQNAPVAAQLSAYAAQFNIDNKAVYFFTNNAENLQDVKSSQADMIGKLITTETSLETLLKDLVVKPAELATASAAEPMPEPTPEASQSAAVPTTDTAAAQSASHPAQPSIAAAASAVSTVLPDVWSTLTTNLKATISTQTKPARSPTKMIASDYFNQLTSEQQQKLIAAAQPPRTKITFDSLSTDTQRALRHNGYTPKIWDETMNPDMQNGILEAYGLAPSQPKSTL